MKVAVGRGLGGFAVLAMVFAASTLPSTAHAAKSATVAKKAKPKPKKFPISGQATLGTTMGLGTFVPGEQNRTSIGTSLSMFFLMPVATGLRVAFAQSMSKSLVDFAEDPFAPRARNTSLGDMLVLFLWTPMTSASGPKRELTAAEKAAAALNPSLAADGAGKPVKLPGGINIQFQAGFTLPFSKIAKFQSRYSIARLAANFSKNISGVNILYQFRYDHRFNKYSNWVADYSQIDGAPLSRDGEAEDIEGLLMATRNVNIARTIRNRLMVTKGWGKFSLQANYSLAINFNEYDSPQDEFTSPYAKDGYGRLDLAFASLAANYNFGGGWFGSFSTSTWSAPWTNDNKSLRIPFFDPRYASANITSLNLSLTKGF